MRCSPNPAAITFLAFLPVASAIAGGEARQTFNIPRQTLSSALLQFSEDSGVKTFFNDTVARNILSPGLSGNYTPEEALEKLLANTGVSYRFTDTESVALVATASGVNSTTTESGATTLKPMTVVGEAVYDSTDPYNPNYNRTSASTATKTDTPIMETPVSVQIVPKAVINDQQAIRVGDALRNVSGYFDSRGEEFFYDTAYLRGFDTDSRQYIDGLRDLAQSHSLANIERIEVLKGPAGALYGRLEPGGLINYITKRPLDTPYYSVQQQFGSFDLYRTQADATGPVTQDGSLLYRFNMEYLSSNSYIDVVRKERGFVAPSLTWKVSPGTQLDVDFRYHDVNGPTTFGVPAIGNRPANIPISRFVGEQGTDDADYNLLYGGMSLKHAFSDHWKLNAQVGYNSQEAIFKGTFIDVLNEATGDASRFYSSYDYYQDSIQGLINVTGKFKTSGIEHTLTFGGDIYKADGKTAGGYFLCEACGTSFPAPINIYQPIVYGRPGINLAQETPYGGSSGRTSWWGLYLQDQITFLDDWHLMFGTRYDQARTSYSNSPTTDDGEFSPRVGLLYRPLDWLSVYANYVKALNAANGNRIAPGTQRKPEMSEGYEAGLKGEWWGGKLTSSLAYYELTKKNIGQPNPDPKLSALGYNVFIGEGRSQGIEFDISGQVSDSWSLIGTYSYTNTEVTKDSTGIEGNQFANVPEHAGSLWSKYDFAGFGWRDLWAGAGIYLVDQRQGDSANSYQLPGYARVDAALGYAFHAGPSKVSLQFNIDNLLDKQYYSASTWGARTFGIQPGAPRTFFGSVRVEF